MPDDSKELRGEPNRFSDIKTVIIPIFSALVLLQFSKMKVELPFVYDTFKSGLQNLVFFGLRFSFSLLPNSDKLLTFAHIGDGVKLCFTLNTFNLRVENSSIIFLGTGTSTGVPYLGCDCEVCSSSDSRDKRLRTSALLTVEGKRFLIDAGPDLRQQLLRHNIRSIDALLLTHEHYDHVGGLDDVRPLGNVDIYGEKNVLEAIRRNMPYCFDNRNYPGLPRLKLHSITTDAFELHGVEIIPIRAFHGRLPILGFRIGDAAYLTDVKTVPAEEMKKLEGLKLLVVNALRKHDYFSHFTLDEAIRFSEKVGAKQSYFTHIAHNMGLYKEIEKELPANMHLAFDNLIINF